MENPIKFLEEVPQHIKDLVAKEVQKGELRAQIGALELADFVTQKAALSAHLAMAQEIDSLKAKLNAL